MFVLPECSHARGFTPSMSGYESCKGCGHVRPVVTHTPSATHEPHGGHGYNFRPTCSCGWSHAVRYAAEHAALDVAQEHVTAA